MEKFLKCPFCGKYGTIEILNAHTLGECSSITDNELPCNCSISASDCYFHSVVCCKNKGGCGSSTGYYLVKEDAIAAWNRRAND